MPVRFGVVTAVSVRVTGVCAFRVLWGSELLVPFVTVASDFRGYIGCAAVDSRVVVVRVAPGDVGRVICNVSLCWSSRRVPGVVHLVGCAFLAREVSSGTADVAWSVLLVRGG